MNCTSYDLDNEKAFAARVSERFPNVRLAKLSNFQKLDFAALIEDRVVAFIEFKQRTHRSDSFKDAFLNCQKLVACRSLHETTGLPVLVAFAFDDGIDLLYQFDPNDRFPIAVCNGEAVAKMPLSKFFRLNSFPAKLAS